MNRIAIVGLDGLGWNTIRPLLKSYGVKNLHRLLDKSIYGVMKCIPPLTPPSWTSIFTGVHPEKHGIHSFMKTYKKGKEVKTRLYNAYDIRYPRINEILAMNNMSGLVMNHILAFPLNAQYRRNQVFVFESGRAPRKLSSASSVHGDIRCFESANVDAILNLNEELTPDFLMAIFAKPDSIFHRNPLAVLNPFNEEIRRFMSKIAYFLDKLRREYDVIVIVSDHGFDTYLTGINMLGIINEGLSNAKESFISKFVGFVLGQKPTKLLTYSLLVNKIHPLSIKKYITMRERETSGNRHIRTNSMCGRIFYDVAHGASSWVICNIDKKTAKKVYNILNNYERLFERLYIFPTTDDMWNLRVVPKRGYYLAFENLLKRIRQPLVNIAVTRHSPNGVFIMYDKERRSGLVIKDIRTVDLVPTVLARLNLDIPSYTDGRILLPNATVVRRTDYRIRLKVLKTIQKLKTTKARLLGLQKPN